MMSCATFGRWLNRAEDRLADGDADSALRAPEVAAGQPAQVRARAWALRAAALRREGNRREATAAYSRALELSPSDSWLHARLSIFLADFELLAAEAAADMALQLATSSEDVAGGHAARGHARYLRGDHGGAIADWATAARLAPSGSSVQITSVFNLGVDLARRRDPAAAAAALEICAAVRRELGTRRVPKLRALIRWCVGVAEAVRGRRYVARRHLIRALRQMARTGDVAAAALIAADLAELTGRPVDPAQIAAEAEADPETVERIRRLAAALDRGETDRQELAAVALRALRRRHRRGAPRAGPRARGRPR